MKQLSANLYMLTGLVVGRVYLLQNGAQVTLIDSGLPQAAPLILKQLQRAGFAPSAVTDILVTHAHIDHIGGLAALQAATGARVYCGAADAPVVAGQQPQQMPALASLSWPQRLLRLGQGDTYFKATPIFQTLHGGESLPIWGGLQAVALPGHTLGQMGYWQPEQQVLFCGDALIRLLTLDLPIPAFTVSPTLTRQSCQHIAALNPTLLAMGHGQPLRGDVAGAIQRLLARL